MAMACSTWKMRVVFGIVLVSVIIVIYLEETQQNKYKTAAYGRSQRRGLANLHVFKDWCGRSVADLRKNIHYPLFPHFKTTVQMLAVSPQATNYGLRIFGYLYPYTDGEFVFAVSSDDNSEFWLSTDNSTLNVELLAWVGKTGAEWTALGEFTKFASQTSRPVWLSAEKRYFFEVIHQQDDKGIDHVAVAWRLPNSTRFTVIESKHIGQYIDVDNVNQIPQTPASHKYIPTEPKEVTVDMKREDPRDTFYQMPLMKSVLLHGVLPNCLYQPTYTLKGRRVARYQGLRFVHLSSIYPNDYTRLTHLEGQDSCVYKQKPSLLSVPAPINDKNKDFDRKWSQTIQVEHVDLQEQRTDKIELECNMNGNLLLNPGEALLLAQAFMDKLNKKHNSLYTLVRVVNVVKHADGSHGSRYLLELEVKDSSDELVRLSRYVYTNQPPQQGSETVLCNPSGLEWNPNVTVHIIVAVKNQGRWVSHLISKMEKLFQITGDTNCNLILIDYSSTDLDVKRALQLSTIPRYQYKKLEGNFQRAGGLQAGIDLVKDEHSIIFLFDLHMEFPHSIIDMIRKYTVEGHVVFAPVIMRLDCGSSYQEARGFWEMNGFGLIGIYKSDLIAIGGMNTREYKYNWGGEDWELLDRVIEAGLEVERLYMKNFFHYYHSKNGMWTN